MGSDEGVGLMAEGRAPLSEQVSRTLRNTFWLVGALLAVMGGSSLLARDLHASRSSMLVLFAVGVGLIFAISKFRNSGWGVAGLVVFAGMMGVSMGPLIGVLLRTGDGAAVLATAAGLTAATTVGCATYAINSRRDFSRMRGFLFGALIVLVLSSLLLLFVNIPALHVAVSAGGALLFTLFLLLDVGDVVSGKQQNYVMASLDIFLDVVNLFTSLLSLGRK